MRDTQHLSPFGKLVYSRNSAERRNFPERFGLSPYTMKLNGGIRWMEKSAGANANISCNNPDDIEAVVLIAIPDRIPARLGRAI